MSHYFTNDEVKSNLKEIKIDILDTSFYFDGHGVLVTEDWLDRKPDQVQLKKVTKRLLIWDAATVLLG